MKNLKTKSHIAILFLSAACCFFTTHSSDSISDESGAFNYSSHNTSNGDLEQRPMFDAFGSSLDDSSSSDDSSSDDDSSASAHMLSFSRISYDETITASPSNMPSSQQNTNKRTPYDQTATTASNASPTYNIKETESNLGRLIKKDSLGSLVPTTQPIHQLNDHVTQTLDRLIEEERIRSARKEYTEAMINNMVQAALESDVKSATESDSLEFLVINPFDAPRNAPLSQQIALNCEISQQHEASTQPSLFQRLFSCCYDHTND